MRGPIGHARELVARLVAADAAGSVDTFDQIVTHAALDDAQHDPVLRAEIRRAMADVANPSRALFAVFVAVEGLLVEQDRLDATAAQPPPTRRPRTPEELAASIETRTATMEAVPRQRER